MTQPEGVSRSRPQLCSRAHKAAAALSALQRRCWSSDQADGRRRAQRTCRPQAQHREYVLYLVYISGFNLLFPQHGVLEAMRDVAHQLQRAALEPPGDGGQRAGVRPGANPAGRGAALPAAEQPEAQHHQPEGDQSEAADVTGTPITSYSAPRATCGCCSVYRATAKEAVRMT